uniref:NADH-ubiquinone oxidoreductase chain 6 n=1 Tax=Tettigades undata TaxID=1445915 RepID=A0A3S5GL86_9HEMI|nr:NADH dehydrogenase subunit 6 [Tettigades undata]AWV84183.1 NADH dehydrogenase subunit 6 [Tettigades undata]AWV84196.1 NADH dehydrogenase subunit 6 [Tettigades undata]AWV84209.1 NADH dehydrogenase subunit 6 [Tettigades undata]
MKIIFMFSIFFTLMIMLTKHPLSMGFVLLMETILASLLCGLNMSTYLLSYILFLIFIGGMLILFMYMSSIASNEKFHMLNMLSTTIMMMISILIVIKLKLNLEYSLYNNNIVPLELYYNMTMNKLYSLPSGMLTLMMVIYLLFTLIVVSNIIGNKFSPLRSYN